MSETGPQVAPASLANVLAHVQSAAALTVRQREDICSALRVAAKHIGRPLDAIPSNTQVVRGLLDKVVPAKHGLSRGRWANIRSHVYKALDIAGVPRRSGRSAQPLDDAWRRLLSPLPYRPYQVALGPIARFCSERCITPDTVTRETFAAFEADLDEYSGRSRPRASYLDAVRWWNAASSANSAWPQLQIDVRHRRNHYVLPWSTFPATLKADIDAMAADAVGGNPFRPSTCRPIKPVSARARITTLRSLASAMVHQGVEPGKLRTISDLLDLNHIDLGLSFIHDRLGCRMTAHLHKIMKIVCAVGQHWCRLPEPRLDQLKAIRKRCDPGLRGMTDKNRATLRDFRDEQRLAALLSLPERIWRRYADKSKLKVVHAIELQLALAIELLIVAPVRCKNLHSIKIDQHIIAVGTGKNRRIHLHFPEDEVKNEQDLEFELPPATAALLHEYLTRVRPSLVRSANRFLFPGAGDGPKGGALLGEQVADLVEREVGVRVTIHQFRHLAGFLYLKDNPGGHEVVRQLLGHRSIETTVQFYAGMEATEAVRHYDRHVSGLREKALGRGLRGRRGATA